MREEGCEACVEVSGFCEKGLASLVTAGEEAGNSGPLQAGLRVWWWAGGAPL